MKNKSFIGLNQFQIGLPPRGYGYLLVNLRHLEGIDPEDAIAKIKEMGYDPQLRYMTTEDSIDSCLLLKNIKVENSLEEERLGQELESLTIVLNQEKTIAVQCIIGQPTKTSPSSDRAAAISI
ncbi:MAG: hypothetical protein AAGA60_01155 [Cyanobacteria bacterium P01_E01_bin.42]